MAGENPPTIAGLGGSQDSIGAVGGTGDAGKKKRRLSPMADPEGVPEMKPGPADISTLQAYFKDPPFGADDKSKDKKPLRRPKLQYENTYRLESKKPFVPSRAETIINKTLHELLSNFRYCSKTATNTASFVGESIRNRIYNQEYDRYKLIVHVALGPMARQGVAMAFKHLGDPLRDSYAYGHFKNRHIFVVVTVHAVYYD